MDNVIRRLDLNLLLTRDVLLSEQNVTRAAERLHFSQPSVSVHLAKLRDIFKDLLLLPGPRGMRPTARAESLRVRCQRNRRSSHRRPRYTWRIAATDYSETTVLMPALNRLRAEAPNTRVAVLEMVPARTPKQAEQGDIDLAFHTTLDAPPGLHHRLLFKESYVLVGRRDHPKLRRRSTLAQFAKLEHVIVSPDGGGFQEPTDDVLAERGLSRRVVMSVPHFLFMRSLIEETDLVGMLPVRLVRDRAALRVVPPPIEVPGYEMTLCWHERVHRDPAHRWLRDVIASSV